MRYIIAIVATLLVSCATSFDTLDRALPQLDGKHITVAADYLGIPDGEYMVAGRKIYVWSSSTINPFVRPLTTSTNGTVGGSQFSAISTTYAPNNTTLNCRIRMSTSDDIIHRIEYNGNNGACMIYSERLKPLVAGAK